MLTGRRGVSLPTTGLALCPPPLNGEDEQRMYLTYLDQSHELNSSYQLAFAERLHAILRCVVPYRSIWFKLHCPERGLRVSHPVKP